MKEDNVVKRRRMRCGRIAIAAMGMSSIALTGCSEERPPETQSISFSEGHAYQSVEECVSANIFTQSACEQAYQGALQAAPRFNSLSACEAEFGEGACQQPPARVQEAAGVSSGGGWFMPAMMGYLVGNAMSSSNRGASVQHIYHEPVYRDRNNRGDWSAASAAATSRATSRNQSIQQSISARNQAAATSRPKATQRSGFASSSSARGSWGS
ncbi:DUF1190 domain-containing protein [Billgrantia sp. Q4P2]|uniref:DUF1190 domain-containing protein n=1 Tax=Billgrantia sp. Q4P2 TaxID=3463857 RepID=UPI00405634C8